MKRELRNVEKAGGSVYGICPEGHGDEQGEIAAEVSAGRRSYPNCPICGSRLKDTYKSWPNRTSKKPKWANWIEDYDHPHLVTGIECRRCRATIAGLKARPPDEHGQVWERLNHEERCPVAQLD